MIHSLPWITIFWSRVGWFANDFHEWRSHEWKSLANHLTRDQKIVIHGNSCIILYIFYINSYTMPYTLWGYNWSYLALVLYICIDENSSYFPGHAYMHSKSIFLTGPVGHHRNSFRPRRVNIKSATSVAKWYSSTIHWFKRKTNNQAW